MPHRCERPWYNSLHKLQCHAVHAKADNSYVIMLDPAVHGDNFVAGTVNIGTNAFVQDNQAQRLPVVHGLCGLTSASS